MRWQLAILWLFFFASAESDIKRRRQIVTPKHLMETRFQPIQQGKVMVTPQNLREVSDLRATIHKSVDEGTYVVASSPSQNAIRIYFLNLSAVCGKYLCYPH
ncbi:uncharacterized protein LOC108102408 isoform X2 [Drosophila eugracilis]|uniref:uncharacterized protein LOC108102408 isoform X2 n=1 Tax=Drosophila eugracilis TaxID=29029 RepID=UPI0007E63F0D|nr:uncharacterized protein LOC108102408 isoform X2 [Drosophila eugracilis]